MNRELQQVRRYWPKAKQSKSGARFWAAGKRVNLTLVAEVWEVDGVSDAPLPSLKHIGATIAEAMRAAGFGVRPPGIMGRDPARVLADRQRPCKGARLGKKKRAVVDKARAQFWPKYFDQVLTRLSDDALMGPLWPVVY